MPLHNIQIFYTSLLLSTVVAQNQLGSFDLAHEGCTFSAQSHELLYAPSICNEEWIGCSVHTWLTLNGVPFDSALWTLTFDQGLAQIQNEGRKRGFLTTLDGEFVVSSTNLGVEARQWILHRIKQGIVVLENARFRGKFLSALSGSAMSKAVSLKTTPQNWHLTCRADKAPFM